MAYTRLGSWCGKGIPSQRSLTGLRGCTVTLGVRIGPSSFMEAAVWNIGQ